LSAEDILPLLKGNVKNGTGFAREGDDMENHCWMFYTGDGPKLCQCCLDLSLTGWYTLRLPGDKRPSIFLCPRCFYRR
jgi:hypothetical protein